MISRVYVEIDTALMEVLNDPTTKEKERTEALRESELLRIIKRLETMGETLGTPRQGAPILERERERQGLQRERAHLINILGRKAGLRTLNTGEESAPLFPRAYARIEEQGRNPPQSDGAILTYRDVMGLPLRATESLLSDIIPYSKEAQPIGTGEAWDGLLDRMGETHAYLFLSLIEWSRVLDTEQGRTWLRDTLTKEADYIEERLNELSEEWDELKERGETESIRDPFRDDPDGRGMFGLRGVRVP